MFPTVLPATAKNMSKFLTYFLLPLYVTPAPRLCGCHHHVSVPLRFIVVGVFCPKMVQRPYSKLGRRVVPGREGSLCRIVYMTVSNSHRMIMECLVTLLHSSPGNNFLIFVASSQFSSVTHSISWSVCSDNTLFQSCLSGCRNSSSCVSWSIVSSQARAISIWWAVRSRKAHRGLSVPCVT
jgi:hypothetical protein